MNRLFSMESMFEQIVKILNDNEKLIPEFKSRLDSILSEVVKVGSWTLWKIYMRN